MTVQQGPCDWPITFECAPDWDTLTDPIKTVATTIAKFLMWTMMGRRYGTCEVAVRPCRTSMCSGVPSGGWWSSTLFIPHVLDGVWVNSCPCDLGGGGNCSCGPLCYVRLPGPVDTITEVKLDGVVVDPSKYDVYDHQDLTRVDGECWPNCQDFTADTTEAGSFLVTYQRGMAPPAGTDCITGVLANEIGKSCAGKPCRLARAVSSVTRQGVNLQFVPYEKLVDLKLTGIPEVDQWVIADNPDRLASDSVVWSPDLRRGRVKTS